MKVLIANTNPFNDHFNAEDDIKYAVESPDWKKGDEKLKLKLLLALFNGVIF